MLAGGFVITGESPAGVVVEPVVGDEVAPVIDACRVVMESELATKILCPEISMIQRSAESDSE